jgi:hypothetical protein
MTGAEVSRVSSILIKFDKVRLENPLPRTLTFTDPEKIRELASG